MIGKSLVYQILERSYGASYQRHNFLDSLFAAYKDDLQHAITLEEVMLMLEKELKKCIQALRRTGVAFPEMGKTTNLILQFFLKDQRSLVRTKVFDCIESLLIAIFNE